MTKTYNQPDWVMVGATMTDGRVRLIASVELNDAELRVEVDKYRLLDETDEYGNHVESHRSFLDKTYYLSTSMRSFVMLEADTYQNAFEALFRQWSPEPKRSQIDEQKRIAP